MKEFFVGPWTSGIIIGVIMLVVYIVHGGQQFTNHDDRILYNSEKIAGVQVEFKEQMADMRHEFKAVERTQIEQSNVIQEIRIDFTRIETRLNHIDEKLDRLLVDKNK